jgi:hypothetical protein
MNTEVSWQHSHVPATKRSVQMQSPLRCFLTLLTSFLRWRVFSTSFNSSKLQDHPLSTLRNCLFGILGATPYIWGPFWASQGKYFGMWSAIIYGTTAPFHVLPNNVFAKERGIWRDVILSATENTIETWPLRKPEIIRALNSPEPPRFCNMLGVLPIWSALPSACCTRTEYAV